MCRFDSNATVEEIRVDAGLDLRAPFRPQIRISEGTRAQRARDVRAESDAIGRVGRIREERLRCTTGTPPRRTKAKIVGMESIKEPPESWLLGHHVGQRRLRVPDIARVRPERRVRVTADGPREVQSVAERELLLDVFADRVEFAESIRP